MWPHNKFNSKKFIKKIYLNNLLNRYLMMVKYNLTSLLDVKSININIRLHLLKIYL